MKYLYFLLFVFSSISINAQHIVWESEYLFEEPTSNSFCPVMRDSDNNYVVTVDDCLTPFVLSYFLKYDSSGAVLNYNPLFYGDLLVPLYCNETDFGYRIMAATSSYPVSRKNGLLPIIINVDKEGDTINILEQYDKNDLYNDSLPRFYMTTHENAFIYLNGLYYNSCVKTKIITEDNMAHALHHIVLSCFDSTGTVVWRKGYDTLDYSSSYSFADFKLSADSSSLYTLINYYENGNDRSQAIIMETDLLGNIIRKLQYTDTLHSIYSKELVSLKDGNIILFWSAGGAQFWKINPQGETIQEKALSLGGIDNLHISPNGSIYAYDAIFIDEGEDPDDRYDNIYDMYLCKISQYLEVEWEFTWNRHVLQDASEVSDILFLDDNNFILSGHKDRFKHYLAKFSEEPEGVNTQGPNNNIFITTFPNPVTDICEIKLNNIQALNLEIAIYDILGNKVKDVSNEPALAPQKSFIVNLSGLAPGSYFVSVNAGGKMIRKKILKI